MIPRNINLFWHGNQAHMNLKAEHYAQLRAIIAKRVNRLASPATYVVMRRLEKARRADALRGFSDSEHRETDDWLQGVRNYANDEDIDAALIAVFAELHL